MADFEAIYNEHFQNVYRYVYSMCLNEAVAEEITQDTFYKALENLHKFKGQCRLYVWLCQIAKNTYFTYLKKQRRHTSEIEGAMEPDFEGAFIDKETAWTLHQLLHWLPEPYKEVFSLRVFGQLPFAQIAQLFGKTESWARLIFYRAKTSLRKGLDDHDM